MLEIKSGSVAIPIVIFASMMAAEVEKTFSMPESLLLFGNYGELHLVTPDYAQVLKPPVDEGFNRGYFAFPSVAHAGDLVAWGFATGWDTSRHRGRFALGIYSLKDQKWRTYGDFADIGDVSFSPNGSRVAVVVDPPPNPRFVIFDTHTESFQELPYQRGMPHHSNLSWSPDATRLATEIHRGEKPSVVAFLDVKTAKVQELGEGFGPRWSPTGEWIAYYSRNQCVLVHPDGTGTKVVMKLGRSRNFGWGSPVWSPDAKQLLLNVSKNGGPLLDVVLLDLATGGTTAKSTSGLPVFGWVPYRSSEKLDH